MGSGALATLAALATLLTFPSIAAEADEHSPQTFEDDIAALEKADPGSPEALNDRLEYAGYLIDAEDSDCHQRLDIAQLQLDTVARTPAANVVLPNGRARLADIQYRVKLARCSCGASPAERESDLREALGAAQRAVDFYRDALDYQSMATMQFNVAVTQRMLGDNDSAVASLESAVALDREYGFRQDFEDNSTLLPLWKAPGKGEPAVTAPTVAAPDDPTRTASLKFAWVGHDATVGVKIDHAGVVDGKVIHGSGFRPFKQHVRAGHDGWIVSYEAGQIAYEGAAGPNEPREARELAHSLVRTLLLPGFEVDAKGDFKQVTELKHVVFDQAAVAITDRVEENYDFEAAVWIGATLEQGVWYNMSGQLILPGTRQLLFSHDVEFAYTRDVPCTPTSTSPSCIEIVVHATPQAERLTELLNYANRTLLFHRKVRSNYWSTTDMRIVTDPNTLTTYVYDVRRYWHASGGALESDKPENHFEKLVATFTSP